MFMMRVEGEEKDEQRLAAMSKTARSLVIESRQ
jgi:hypothetical protein